MSTDPPIPKIQLFQNLTSKIQGQCHGWGQSLKSQSGSDFLSTHNPFVPCQSATPLPECSFFEIWPWNSKVKVMDQVKIQNHQVGPTSYRIASLSSHVSPPISGIQLFQNLTLKNSKSRLAQGHIVGPTSYRLVSLLFHVNQLHLSWNTALSKFVLENSRSR